MSADANSIDHSDSPAVELNVGGVMYTTSLFTLTRKPDSRLAALFKEDPDKPAPQIKDSKGKVFIDRDGVLFRYILDYLRNLKLVLPENFHEKERLRQEADYYRLPELVSSLSLVGTKPLHPIGGIGGSSPALVSQLSRDGSSSLVIAPVSDRPSGFITVGYRGTFAFGRDGLADVKFRKLSRIIVSGKVSLCREVFKDTLNESRDPDRGDVDRYTGRYFLKHTFLEQAFDMLQEEGFFLVGACGSGTNSAGEIKAGMDTEEAKWQHYNEFIFERR